MATELRFGAAMFCNLQKRELLCVGSKVGLRELGVQTACKLPVERNCCGLTCSGRRFRQVNPSAPEFSFKF
jgi:hypothetical protein